MTTPPAEDVPIGTNPVPDPPNERPVRGGSQLDEFIDRVNRALAAGRITQTQANNLIRRARNGAVNGSFSPELREQLRAAFEQARERTARQNPPPDGGDGDTPGDGDGDGTGDGTEDGGDDTGDEPGEEDGGPEEPSPQTQATRGAAREYLAGLFAQFGFDPGDAAALMTLVDEWISEGLADVGGDAILMRFRGTDIYRRRFQGMQALIDRGQAISEAEYIELERGYRRVLSAYGLPREFYDNYDDYARFIANDISVNEVESRVFAARQMLDNADPRVLNELQDYYGVTSGGALAYLLDADKAQQTIRQQVRAAQIGGSAERYGFSMDRSQSEMLGSTTIGLTLNPFEAQTQAQLDATFAQARRTATRDRTLAAIDSETYSDMDTLQAAFGDDDKRLASERRGKRERSRFSGNTGSARAGLGVSRNI